MSLQDLIAADASALLLNTQDFGESITHRPFGDDASDVAVVAVVSWDPPAEHADGGQGHKLTGRLDVAGDLACDVADQWVIGGTLYQTLTVGEPQGGLRLVTIQRTTIQRRGKARPVM